jgi:gamma-glutamyltranspeptidase / glutathione hydrolase
LLSAGGNAVDAACATALALGVVDPFASGLGGGGFALVYLAKRGTATALDFREVAPAALTEGGIKPQSGRSVGVPGEARGLAELVRRFGRLPFSRCVEPALRLARGFRASPRLARQVADELERNPVSGPHLVAQLFAVRGRPASTVAAGDVVARPCLEHTLERMRRHGADVLYRGDVARKIASATRAEGGVLALDDMGHYAPIERKPLEVAFLGKRVLLMPPPSAAGLVVPLGLAIASEHLAKLRGQGPRSPDYLHLLAEALKHGFADRTRFLGDPAFAEIPLGRLLDPAYHHELSSRTKIDRVLAHDQYGMTSLPASGEAKDAGTAHVSVIDSDGNAVALTTTINLEFGARIVAGDTGILLNDEMDDFSTPGSGDVFELSGGTANLPAPGKRPASAMSPTIVLGEHGVEMVTGAAGGPRIVSSVLQILLDVMVFGMDAKQAIVDPRIHHQWEPDVLLYEPGLAADILSALEGKGHKTKLRQDIGKANVILRSPAGLDAAADPRSGGQPAGE